MGTGVAGALKRAGGEEIEREAVAKGPIEVGDAVATGAGRLPARWVIHGAVMGQDLRTSADLIERTTSSVLRVADELGARSLALPAFGTGVGGFPLDGRATIVAGAGTNDTAHSIHLTQQAGEIGVDGLLVVAPYYNKPPQRGIVEHFKAIAGSSDQPIIVYNIPSRVVVNIEPQTIERLAEIPTVRAVKQAHDDIEQARMIPGFGLDLY